MISSQYTASLWRLFMTIHGCFGAFQMSRFQEGRAALCEKSYLKTQWWRAEHWTPHLFMDWTGLSEDGGGDGPFPLGLQMLGRSPGNVGNASRASSHCWPALVPWGHRMVIGQETEAKKCCCREPNHKGQPGGWLDPLAHQKAFYNCVWCTFEN